MKFALALLLLSLAAVGTAAGVSLIYLPAGVITASLELAGVAYVLLYVERQGRR